VDCDSSPNCTKWTQNVAPCITSSRGSGHWVTNRGRRLRKQEMMRLQGMNPTTFKVAISETQLGKQLGNTMSVNVLERLFVRLLPAAGLARGELKDRWATGQAVKKLADTRDKLQPFWGSSSRRKMAMRVRGLKREASDSSASSASAKRMRMS